MPTRRFLRPAAAAVPALLLATCVMAQHVPLPPCSGSQERWNNCSGSFEDSRNGVHYQGEFRNGTMDGVGIMRTALTVYSGEFSQGRMHGQGVLTMVRDQRKYLGAFRNGLMHGNGSIVGADGRVLVSGRWQDGTLQTQDAPAAEGAGTARASSGGSPVPTGGGLGAQLADAGPGRPPGALVVDVAPGSAARRGGLAPGDVVVGLGGWRVSRPGDLEAAVGAIERDGVVMMRLLRNGIEMELAVPLASVSGPAAPAAATAAAPATPATLAAPAPAAARVSPGSAVPATGRAATAVVSSSASAAAPGGTVMGSTTSTAATSSTVVASTTATGGAGQGVAGSAVVASTAATPPAPGRPVAAMPGAPAPTAAPASPAPQRPAAAAAPPAPAVPAATGAPEGLYLARQGQASLKDLEVWYFSGGRFVQSPRLATLGVSAPFDFARAEAQRPGSSGTLTVEGERMALAGPALVATVARLEPLASDCFRWNVGLYCPAPRFERGARLQGSYASAAGPDGLPALRASFKADGSYEIVRGAASRETGKGAARPPGRERGRYEIDGNLVRLRPTGALPEALTVVPYDDGTPGPAPRRLYLGGLALGRQ